VDKNLLLLALLQNAAIVYEAKQHLQYLYPYVLINSCLYNLYRNSNGHARNTTFWY